MASLTFSNNEVAMIGGFPEGIDKLVIVGMTFNRETQVASLNGIAPDVSVGGSTQSTLLYAGNEGDSTPNGQNMTVQVVSGGLVQLAVPGTPLVYVFQN